MNLDMRLVYNNLQYHPSGFCAKIRGMIQKELRAYADPKKAKDLQRFFKTGPGEYAEGDHFLGIYVPILRTFARRYAALPTPELQVLIKSSFHEERALALFILKLQFEHGDAKDQKRILGFYLKHRRYINNWDLVDVTTPYIVGASLFNKKRDLLYKYACSRNLWERRISIIATAYFIREGDFADTLKIANILLNDEHDLIHKAVGWMLREVGKRDQGVLEKFLNRNSRQMPRTMLRYAIERLPERKRKYYLNLKSEFL